MMQIKTTRWRGLVAAAALASLAACDIAPTAQSDSVSPSERQAAIDKIVRYGINGDVRDMNATGQLFQARFWLKERYVSNRELTKEFGANQPQMEKPFISDMKSRYDFEFDRNDRIKFVSLILYVNRSFCLSPDEIHAAIPEHYRGGEKLKHLIGIFPPKGESLPNSSLFKFTSDNACLEYVRYSETRTDQTGAGS